MLTRRAALLGLGATFAAPAVVQAASLMPIRGTIYRPYWVGLVDVVGRTFQRQLTQFYTAPAGILADNCLAAPGLVNDEALDWPEHHWGQVWQEVGQPIIEGFTISETEHSEPLVKGRLDRRVGVGPGVTFRISKRGICWEKSN